MSLDTLQRIDIHPTHTSGGFNLRVGKPIPFGATPVPGGVNFSVYSSQATSCTLVLFERGQPQPMAEIPFPREFCIGNVFAMVVFDIDIENTEYGYRMEGPCDPQTGHRFDSTKVLLDPYARAIGGRDVWGTPPDWSDIYQHRGVSSMTTSIGRTTGRWKSRSKTWSSTRCTCVVLRAIAPLA